MQFHDYYETLGVDKKASQAEIKKAFRNLSKQYHPDRNKDAGAEDKFKEVSEAYEVLKDPERRAKYDQMRTGGFGGGRGNMDWDEVFKRYGQGGGSPGWQNVDFNFGQGGGGRSSPPSGFSDFFDAFFGGFQQGRSGADPFGGARGAPRGPSGVRTRAGEDKELEITISLEDAMHGATKKLAVDRVLTQPDGGRRSEKKTYTVKIPAGATDGTKIRLAGQGKKGVGGGKDGDLYLRVHLAPHPRFKVDGHDLLGRLELTPWEAALGAKVEYETLDGAVKLTIPPGSSSGKKLRLKGKGLPKKKSGKAERGNLEVELLVALPEELSDEEKELLEKWRELSAFNPRGG